MKSVNLILTFWKISEIIRSRWFKLETFVKKMFIITCMCWQNLKKKREQFIFKWLFFSSSGLAIKFSSSSNNFKWSNIIISRLRYKQVISIQCTCFKVTYLKFLKITFYLIKIQDLKSIRKYKMNPKLFSCH